MTEEEITPSQYIGMDSAWSLVAVTREQANAYFHRLANQFESDMEIRDAFLQAAELVLVAPLPPAPKEEA